MESVVGSGCWHLNPLVLYVRFLHQVLRKSVVTWQHLYGFCPVPLVSQNELDNQVFPLYSRSPMAVMRVVKAVSDRL